MPAIRSLKFGQSAPMTGPAQRWGIEYHRGLALAFADHNNRTGADGVLLDLILSDDQYEWTLAVQNTQDFVRDDEVFGFIGYVGSECALASRAVASAAGKPFISPLSGSDALRTQPSRWLLTTRADDDAEARVLASALRTIDFKRIAAVVQSDADGQSAMRSHERAIASLGRPPVIGTVQVSRNPGIQADLGGVEMDTALRLLREKNADAIVCLCSFSTTAEIVRRLRKSGFAGGCYATNLSSSGGLGTALGRLSGGLSITQVVPSPFVLSTPLVSNYRSALASSGGQAPEYVSLEGWIAGRMVFEVVKWHAGGRLTRDLFMKGFEGLANVDLDGLPLHWHRARRELSFPVTLSVLNESGRPLN